MPQAPVQTASWAQRLLALVIDWVACSLVVFLIAPEAFTETGSPLAILVNVLFVLESAFFMSLLGGSFGQLACRIRVTRMDGSNRWPDPLRALLRQFLVVLVIPPLIFRPDGRGLHDMAAKTSTNTLESLRRG